MLLQLFFLEVTEFLIPAMRDPTSKFIITAMKHIIAISSFPAFSILPKFVAAAPSTLGTSTNFASSPGGENSWGFSPDMLEL